MSHKQTDKHITPGDASPPGSQFFREDAFEVLKLGKDQRALEKELTFASVEESPVLPSSELAGEPERKVYWRALRNFFRNVRDRPH